MYETYVSVLGERTLTEISATALHEDSTAAIEEAFETAFHMTGVAQYLEYNECN